jgi:hypothetical protein
MKFPDTFFFAIASIPLATLIDSMALYFFGIKKPTALKIFCIDRSPSLFSILEPSNKEGLKTWQLSKPMDEIASSISPFTLL